MDQSSDIRLLCEKNSYYYPSWCGIDEAVVGSNAFPRELRILPVQDFRALRRFQSCD